MEQPTFEPIDHEQRSLADPSHRPPVGDGVGEPEVAVVLPDRDEGGGVPREQPCVSVLQPQKRTALLRLVSIVDSHGCVCSSAAKPASA